MVWAAGRVWSRAVPAAILAQDDLTNHVAVDVVLAITVGFVIAALARVLVPRVRSISWPTSALLGALAGSVSFGLASFLGRDPTWPAMVLALALTIVLLLAATMVESRMRPAVAVHTTPTVELLRLGESGVVEFKSTARRNLHSMERDPKIEGAIAKTVCGFLNGRGGTLVVGVDDHGVPLGLDADMELMKTPDIDSYQLFLRDLLSATLGVPAASGVRVRFDEVGSGEGDAPQTAGVAGSDPTRLVCRVDVVPSPDPVFLTPAKQKGEGQREPEFWVRAGNGTRRLRIDELLDYNRRRWGTWTSRFGN